jgi:hypothetical protein
MALGNQLGSADSILCSFYVSFQGNSMACRKNRARLSKGIAQWTALILLLLMAILPLGAQSQNPKPLSPSTVGLLYDGNQDPVSGARGFVTSIASWRNFIYASWHDLNQNYYLHIWDIQNTRAPRQIVSIYFGQGIDTPSLQHEPKSLHVHNRHLVMNVRNSLVVYPLKDDGLLGAAREYTFPDGIDQNIIVLRHGGNFASTLRTTISDSDYLDAISGNPGVPASTLDEYLTSHVFINLRNPQSPFLQRLRRPYGYGYQSYGEPVTGSYQGNPLIATLSNDNTSLSLTTFTDGASSQLQGFWNSKLPYLFSGGSLNKSISNLSKAAIRGLDPAALHTRLIQTYGQKLRVPLTRKLSAIIRAKWGASTSLESVLASYGINEEDSLRKALSVVLETHIADATRKTFERISYSAALEAWHQKIFSVRNIPLSRIASSIQTKMNEELSEAGAQKYFVKRVLAPLLGDPAYLNYSIEDLLQVISSSGFASTIDALLSTFHAVLPVSDFLSAPQCFQIPQSTSGLLSTAFVQNGPRLNLEGLAAYELMRLGLYYSGEDLGGLSSEVSAAVRTLHEKLSADLVRATFGSLGAIEDLNQKNFTIAKKFASSFDVVDLVTSPLLGSLETLLKRRGINFDSSVKEVLESKGLYLTSLDAPLDASPATIANLALTLDRLGVGALTLQEFLDKTGARRPVALESALEALLLDHARTVFGDILPTTTLKEAATRLLLQKLDPSIMGDFVSETLNSLLKSGFSAVSQDAGDTFRLRGILGRVQLASRGDCISQWELALEAAAALAEGSVFGAGLAPLFLSAEESLSFAAEKGIEASISIMLSELTDAIFSSARKDYSSWHARLSATTNAVDLTPLRPSSLELAKIVPFSSKVGVVMYDQGFFSVEDPRVYLALLSIGENSVSTSTHDIGNWSQINGIRSTGDFLLIDGELIQNGSASHQIKLLDIRTSPPKEYLVRDPDLEVAFQFKQAVPINGGQQLAVMLDAPSEVLFIDLY